MSSAALPNYELVILKTLQSLNECDSIQDYHNMYSIADMCRSLKLPINIWLEQSSQACSIH